MPSITTGGGIIIPPYRLFRGPICMKSFSINREVAKTRRRKIQKRQETKIADSQIQVQSVKSAIFVSYRFASSRLRG
jgi:hypothetical protein